MDLKGMPQTLRGRLNHLVQHTAVHKALAEIGRAGLGFLLAGVTIFGEYAPFGLGYAAASGVKKSGIAGMIGTALGYLCILYRANGLKYLAILALISTALVVFAESKLSETAWLTPTSAAVCTACLGIVFVLDGGVTLQECAFYLTEVVTVFGSAFLYRAFFCAEGRRVLTRLSRAKQRLLGFCLSATLALPLMRVSVPGVVTLGRVAALVCVMLSGYYGGMSAGLVCAVLQGVAAGMLDVTALYCGVFGVAVICACLLKRWGKLGYLSGFLGVALGTMCLLQTRNAVSLGVEVVCAGLLFLPIGNRFSGQLRNALCEREGGSIPLARVTQQSLRTAARAFSDLGEMLHRTFSKERNDQNIVSVFERPARQVCKKCTLCHHCWGKEYPDTRNALNDATLAMQQNGVLKVTDLPFHFSTRCLHIGEFVEQVNRELRTYQAGRAYQSRLRERQDVLCKQYREVSGVLESLAESEPPVPDVSAQKRLQRLLREAGMLADVCVWRDAHHRLHVLMEGEASSEAVLEDFSEQMGVTLGEVIRTRGKHGYCFRVSERENLRAELGVACRKKQGNTVCGDTVGHCKQPNGTVCILLADGMGTGTAAAQESNLAVDLLIRFLESGIAPQSAMATVHSALQLKSEANPAFTTLDLLCVDLFGGECVLYKFGSAPSYFRVGEETKCVTCTSMPLGISCAGAPGVEKIKCRLHAGDDVILMSDGISDQAVPAWLMKTIKEKNGLSAQQFAKEILHRAEAEAQDSDDRTVLVFRLMQE